MPSREQVLRVVREWVEKAENDWRTACHTLGLAQNCPTDAVCFHAQQCVEKYLKALLTLRQIEFPKTHDLGELTARLPSEVDVGLSVEAQRQLTNYATGARYPGWPAIPLSEAREAVRLARRARSRIRKHLPGAGVRQSE